MYIDIHYYSNYVRRTRLLSSKEQQALLVLAKNGNVIARDKLVKSNLRFVFSVAKMYTSSGVPLEDLVQEGNIGLLTAINRFDTSYNLSFLTYAVWWIKQNIVKYIQEKGRVVRLPCNRTMMMTKLTKCGAVEDVMCVGGTFKKVVKSDYPLPDKVRESVNMDLNSATLDIQAPVSIIEEEDRTALLDILLATQEEYKEDLPLANLLGCLTEKEKEIVLSFFGFDEKETSLKDIGERLAISRERVRQIKDNAISKIRYNPILKEL